MPPKHPRSAVNYTTRVPRERYTDPMSRFRILVLCALGALYGVASAQWAWRDAAGNRVYSDQPPPASVPDKDVLRQPGGVRSAAPSEAAAASEAARPASAPAARASAADKDQEAKRKQAEEAEATRKKVAEEKLTRARADNCIRARQAKATLDSGIRIARTNTQGEREILDDAARAAEARRLDGIVASDCG